MHNKKYTLAKEEMILKIKSAIQVFEAEAQSNINRVVIHEKYGDDIAINNIIELNIHDVPIETRGVEKYWR